MILRGTVYVIDAQGTPVDRQVMSLTLENAEQFRQAARTRVLAGGGAPAGATVEFGPIGGPWPATLR